MTSTPNSWMDALTRDYIQSGITYAPFVPIPLTDLSAILSTAASNSRLTIFAGAGISTPHGLPSWNGLLTRLAKQILPNETKTVAEKLINRYYQYTSPLLTARYISHFLRSRTDINDYIKSCLYERLDKTPSATLTALSDLCCRFDLEGSRINIITYNYDNLFEMSATGRFEFDSIFDENTHRTASKRIKVFHVHGYLPIEGVPCSSEITFVEDTYHRLFGNMLSWQNICQANALMNDVCLFIGLSFSDPNLRRVIDLMASAAHTEHFLISRRRSEGDKGLFPNCPDEPLGAEEASFINNVEANVLQEMGVRTCWIDTYGEIEGIINGIKFKKS